MTFGVEDRSFSVCNKTPLVRTRRTDINLPHMYSRWRFYKGASEATSKQVPGGTGQRRSGAKLIPRL